MLKVLHGAEMAKVLGLITVSSDKGMLLTSVASFWVGVDGLDSFDLLHVRFSRPIQQALGRMLDDVKIALV